MKKRFYETKKFVLSMVSFIVAVFVTECAHTSEATEVKKLPETHVEVDLNNNYLYSTLGMAATTTSSTSISAFKVG